MCPVAPLKYSLVCKEVFVLTLLSTPIRCGRYSPYFNPKYNLTEVRRVIVPSTLVDDSEVPRRLSPIRKFLLNFPYTVDDPFWSSQLRLSSLLDVPPTCLQSRVPL